ncbi:hypothetical protein QYE76_004386 [Lolium multiflorum]|uniref:CCHC-type domain-containing protein n=1 Tax=Lolium multiflorum TaxID=4521 RepID=A0AAD8RUK2_LOLMU|nr:hypothetical protein QYE76_004386 [Lolium multiflorum]
MDRRGSCTVPIAVVQQQPPWPALMRRRGMNAPSAVLVCSLASEMTGSCRPSPSGACRPGWGGAQPIFHAPSPGGQRCRGRARCRGFYAIYPCIVCVFTGFTGFFYYVFADMASPINFNQFLEKEKLKSNGSNFTDWFRHVRIFLNGGNLQYVLDAPLGDPPAETETDEVKNVYATRKTRYSQVQCAILCSLEADLQKRFEHHDPHELVNELKTIFETHAAVECYEASKHFFSCMMEEGSSVSEHMLAMTGHAKKLGDLGIVIPNRLGINRVLQSLPPSYKNFVMNYNMQNMNKELPELFAMLKSAEIEIKKEHQVLMVNKTTSFKKQGKSKGKNKKSGKKAATPPVKPKTGPKPDAECYYCKEKGHWKRNCSKYLADLKSGLVKKKKEGTKE